MLRVKGEKVAVSAVGNGGNAGLSSVLEANVKQIVTMARDTYEKYVLCSMFIAEIALLIHPIHYVIKM